MRLTKPQDVLVEAEQLRAGALPQRREVLAVVEEVVVAVGQRGADFLAHEEHRDARRQQRDPGGEVRSRLGVAPRLADQRSTVDRNHDGAGRVHLLAVLLVVGVAGFVVRLVIDDAAAGRCGQARRRTRSC